VSARALHWQEIPSPLDGCVYWRAITPACSYVIIFDGAIWGVSSKQNGPAIVFADDVKSLDESKAVAQRHYDRLLS
jgi:hypothetical protein